MDTETQGTAVDLYCECTVALDGSLCYLVLEQDNIYDAGIKTIVAERC